MSTTNPFPSETFLENLCEQGGASSMRCSCGQFWFGSGPQARADFGDGVGVTHFNGIVWVNGCDCRVAKALAEQEKWLLDNAEQIACFFSEVARRQRDATSSLDRATIAAATLNAYKGANK